MAFTINRIVGTQNDLGGSGAGRVIDETNFENVFSNGANWVHSGLGITLDSPTNGEVTIAGGVCTIAGHYVDLGASDSIDLAAIATDDWFRVWLQLTEDGSGYVDGVQLTATQDTSIPDLAVLLFEVRVGSGGQATDSYDRRAGSPAALESDWGSHTTPAGDGGATTLGWQPAAVFLTDGTNAAILFGSTAIALSGSIGSPAIQSYGFTRGAIGNPGTFAAIR